MWPFHKKVWFKLFLFYVLAGGCSSSTLWRFSSGLPSALNPSAAKELSSTQSQSVAEIKAKIQQTFSNYPDLWSRFETFKSAFIENWMQIKTMVLSFLAVIVFLIFLLWILNMWFQVRMNPVLIKSLIEKRINFGENWAQTADLGRNLFQKNIMAAALSSVPFFVYVGGMLYAIFSYREVLKAHWFLFLISGFVLLLWATAIGILIAIMNAFYPAYVLQSGKNPQEGLSTLKQWVFDHREEAAKIVVLYWICSVVAGAAAGVISAILIGPLIILMGLIGAVSALMLTMTGFLFKSVVLIFLCSPVFLLLILLFVICVVPLETFRRYLRIELIRQLLLKEPPVN